MHAQRFLLLCQQISNNLSKNAFIRGDANVITRRRRLVIRKRFKRNWTSVPLPVEKKETFFFPPLCQETRILPSMDKKKKSIPRSRPQVRSPRRLSPLSLPLTHPL